MLTSTDPLSLGYGIESKKTIVVEETIDGFSVFDAIRFDPTKPDPFTGGLFGTPIVTNLFAPPLELR